MLYLTMWAVARKGPEWAFLVLAAVLVVYSVLGLFRIRLQIQADLEKPLAPVIGVISGFVAGVVGVPVVPLMPYLQGLDIKPSELVQTLGVVLCATSLALAVSLLQFGLLDGPHAMVSAIAVAPAIAGMWVGTKSVGGCRSSSSGSPCCGRAADRPLHFRKPPGVISSAPC